MAIRAQGYRHWDGEYSGHAMRWWTITKSGLRASVSSKVRLTLMLILVVFAWLFPTGIILFEYAPSAALNFAPQDFHLYFSFSQHLVAMLMAAVVGSGLIANDLGSNALHVYLSKPLRRIDYVVGKTGVAAFWVSTVTVFPALFLYFGALFTMNDRTRPDGMWGLLGDVVAFELLVLAVFTLVILAISSMTRKWSFALVAWIGLYLGTEAVAGIGRDVSGEDAWQLIGIRGNLVNVAEALFDVEMGSTPGIGPSLLILGALAVAAAVVYVWRIQRLEVAE